MPKIGVLALQGAFREHVQTLRGLGAEAFEVRLPEQLTEVDGLLIPGGESTTIGKLATSYGLIEPVRKLVQQGKPVWGTCAGMILLANDIGGLQQPLIGGMDITVNRNAFGRQLDSFETSLDVPALDEVGLPGQIRQPFPAIFIRAPSIDKAGPEVEVLARLPDSTIVAARQRRLLATAFHPELTHDSRFHRLFLTMVENAHQPSPNGQREKHPTST